MNNNIFKNNNHHNRRGGRGGYGEHDGSKKTFGPKKPFERNFKEEKKLFILIKKEIKYMKEFKVQLGGNNTEKVILPFYVDDDCDETILMIVKEFNMMIEDGDLFQDDEIEEEAVQYMFTEREQKKKLKAIENTFRKFRSCLKGKARDKWLKLVEDQPILATDNYELDNTYGVVFF